jgi:hypothetical protein
MFIDNSKGGAEQIFLAKYPGNGNFNKLKILKKFKIIFKMTFRASSAVAAKFTLNVYVWRTIWMKWMRRTKRELWLVWSKFTRKLPRITGKIE